MYCNSYLEIEHARLGNFANILAAGDLVQGVELHLITNISVTSLDGYGSSALEAYIEHVILRCVLQVACALVGVFEFCGDHD